MVGGWESMTPADPSLLFAVGFDLMVLSRFVARTVGNFGRGVRNDIMTTRLEERKFRW